MVNRGVSSVDVCQQDIRHVDIGMALVQGHYPAVLPEDLARALLIFRDHGSTEISGQQANGCRGVNGRRHISNGYRRMQRPRARLVSASTAARSAVGNVLDTVD